jgi:hypothetical protein
MGRTKTMITVTEVEYKNYKELYTIFEYNGERAIEFEGYDVSDMELDESQAYEVNRYVTMQEDPEQYIHNYFIQA